MQSWHRAAYIALKDFKYRFVTGMAHQDFIYKEGDIINLRITGRATADLLQKGCIKLLNEKE